jgi:putative ABC transport system permease protein
VQLIPERLKAATVRNRLAAHVFGGFGVGALLLAAIGVYGTLALSVVQRTREFAIRRALGARAESMIAIISRELVVIAGAGIVLGAAASVVLNRMLSSLLYDVRGVEGRIYALSGGVLLASLVIAAILPTLRSLRIDPRMAMRAE